MKFEFVAKHRGAWPVNLMREALGVSRSGFYAWLVRPRSRRSLDDDVLGSQVRNSFVASDRTYGARRVWHDVLELGQRCGLHRIERLMRMQALRARPRRRGLPKDQGERSAIADNVLDRQFQADAPNQKWVADFTYIWTAEGWLYVAVVLDLYSRRAVGWSMQASMTSQLVADALMMAVWRRGRPQELRHHSGQGKPAHKRALTEAAGRTGHRVQHEPRWRGLGQLGDGELLQQLENRTDCTQGLPLARAGQVRRVRLHRAVLQADAPPLDARVRQPDKAREA